MLNVISVPEAAALSARISKKITRTELLPLAALPGRIAAEDVFCAEEIPLFCRSVMDGYAVIAADTFGAGEALPSDLKLLGEVRMGEKTDLAVTPGTCVKISTGGMLPAGSDAVVPVEFTDLDFDTCLVYRAVSPWENVTRIGDDARKNSVLFHAGDRFTPASVGVLAAAGIERCRVFGRVRVGILSTGNEVVPVSDVPVCGKIRDVNSALLSALCGSYGCETHFYGIVPDDEQKLKEALSLVSAGNDIVLLSGGSSAGEKDLTAKVLAEIGEVLAHGIAMKPGKPTVIGIVKDVPVFGLPGHPAACYFVAEALVKPCVAAAVGYVPPARKVTAVLCDNISSNHGREEWICVRLQDGKAYPVFAKSGVVSQLSVADGYMRVPRDCEGIAAGTAVEITLF